MRVREEFLASSCGVSSDLPPPPEPPPSQGQNRVPGARTMVPPTERKAASLERTPMLGGTDDIKSSIDRQTRTSLDQHRQPQDRLGSMDRADDGRRGQKTGLGTRILPEFNMKRQESGDNWQVAFMLGI